MELVGSFDDINIALARSVGIYFKVLEVGIFCSSLDIDMQHCWLFNPYIYINSIQTLFEIWWLLRFYV